MFHSSRAISSCTLGEKSLCEKTSYILWWNKREIQLTSQKRNIAHTNIVHTEIEMICTIAAVQKTLDSGANRNQSTQQITRWTQKHRSPPFPKNSSWTNFNTAIPLRPCPDLSLTMSWPNLWSLAVSPGTSLVILNSQQSLGSMLPFHQRRAHTLLHTIMLSQHILQAAFAQGPVENNYGLLTKTSLLWLCLSNCCALKASFHWISVK